ncbi:hypothetical protein CDD83_6187 [Cordyceps sp. RAO-2017]|nr:hypothetical protein CDD83_6187 [Cordyceps sp. RAO-2017]
MDRRGHRAKTVTAVESAVGAPWRNDEQQRDPRKWAAAHARTRRAALVLGRTASAGSLQKRARPSFSVAGRASGPSPYACLACSAGRRIDGWACPAGGETTTAAAAARRVASSPQLWPARACHGRPGEGTGRACASHAPWFFFFFSLGGAATDAHDIPCVDEDEESELAVSRAAGATSAGHRTDRGRTECGAGAARGAQLVRSVDGELADCLRAVVVVRRSNGAPRRRRGPKGKYRRRSRYRPSCPNEAPGAPAVLALAGKLR